MIHKKASPLAGKTVKIKEGVKDPAQHLVVGGADYVVEDWFDRVEGKRWLDTEDNWPVAQYAFRNGYTGLNKIDDEVLYGKIGGMEHLVHISEIEEVEK